MDIIGIDLGTTNSEVAVVIDDKVEIVKEEGIALVPSFVGVNDNGKVIVGTEARNRYILHPEQTIKSIKRKMGTNEEFAVGDKNYLPQEISAIILRKLKSMAEKRLGREVTKAVITVPAQFSDVQRQATKEAGELAGLEVVRIINEPTAACLAYENSSSKENRKVMAFDFGGGTFDVSIVTMEDDVVEVLSSRGNNLLGGDDIDNLISDWVIENSGVKEKAEFNDLSLYRLNRSSETAKISLSDYPYSKIIESNIKIKKGSPLSLNLELDRTDFEVMMNPIINKLKTAVHQALGDCQLKPGNIDDILLVGGSTRIPVISNMLENDLGTRPRQDIDPDLAVVYGAGIMAARLMGLENQKVLVDITPYTFGTSCLGYVNNEYCPFHYAPILKAGTPLPATKAESFYTSRDNQTKIILEVFQGEDVDARKNIFVGEFEVEGLSEVPQGNELIVNIRLDLDGILRVTATEKSTNLTKEVSIKDVLSHLSKEKLERSKKEIARLFGNIEDNINNADAIKEIEKGNEDTDGENIDNIMTGFLQKAQERVEKNSALMDDVDKEDSLKLLNDLKAAMQSNDRENFDKHMTELDDILFYLEKE